MSDNPRPPRLNLPTMPHDEREPRPNGSAGDPDSYAPSPTPLRRGDARGGRVSNRVVWLDLPRPYDNLEFLAWLDFPKSIDDIRLAPTLPAGQTESAEDQNTRFMTFCQQVILDTRAICEHPGDPQTCQLEHEPWTDRNDEPLPPPETREFWEELPTPLGAAIMTRFWEEMRANPTNRASRRKRRRTWR